MTGFTALDLSRLPAPNVVQPLDYAAILAARKADIVARVRLLDVPLADALAATLAIEGELLTKAQEAGAYRETLHYSRVNDAARAVMLAFAAGADLDQKGADFETPRLVITAAAGNVPAVLEHDERYRRRLQLAPEAFATTGARGAYIFHALTFSPTIVDAWAWRPNVNSNDGVVHVAVIAANGAAVSAPIFTALADYLEREDCKPLTDNVVLRHATRVDYPVTLTAYMRRGPDPALIQSEIDAAVRRYAATRYRIGEDVFLDGIVAAAMVPGVDRIETAFADIVTADHEIGWLSALTITVAYV